MNTECSYWTNLWTNLTWTMWKTETQTWSQFWAWFPRMIRFPHGKVSKGKWYHNLICVLHCVTIIRIGRFLLQWRRNEHDGVGNHRRHDCLLNLLFRLRSRKTSKLRVTGICEGNHRYSLHKWPVPRKMFPSDDGIMSVLQHSVSNGYNEDRLIRCITWVQPHK